MSLPSLYQQFIHVSRYARWRDQDNRRETWEETVDRYLNFMCDEQCPGKIDDKTRAELRAAILGMEVMPSMRCLMTAGPALARDHAAGFNPVAGDTPVLTREHGMRPIIELVGQSATVLNVNGAWTPATFKSYGMQPLYEVVVRKSSKQYERVQCTANHRWVLTDGSVKSTVQLDAGDKLPYASAPRMPNTASLDYGLGVAHGLIYGDGTRQYAQERDKGYLIRVCGDYEDVLACFEKLPEAVVTYPPSFNGDPVVQLYGTFGRTHLLKELPATTETDDYLVGFMRGWLAADGTVDTYGGASLCLDADGLAWLLRVGPRLGFIVQHHRELPEQTNFGKRKQRTFTATLDRTALTADDFIIARKRARFRPLKSEFTVVSWKALGTTGEVCCAQVPATNTFTLAQGLVTGNCTGLIIDSVEAFDEMMYLLMCGCGVGFSVERQFIDKLPAVAAKLRKSPSVIKVDDSRMGWANAVRELISLLYQGRIPEWDVSEVRPAGAKLKTFGGRASGPGPLVDLFRFIINIFRGAEGRKLTSIECHDIACKIGEVVVAGGVRRSAEISLSNLSDDRMRDAKSGQWWETTPWRAMANNSAVYTEKPGMRIWFKEWQALYDSKSGERGIFNREAAKKNMVKYGRRDPNHDFIVNPCVPARAWINTQAGARQVSDLIGRPFTAIVNGTAYPCPAGFFLTGSKPLVKIFTDRGYTLEVTRDHKVSCLLPGRARQIVDIPAGLLVPGNKLVIGRNAAYASPFSGRDFDLGWLVGEIVGDGGYNPAKYPAYLRFWGKSADVMAERTRMIIRRELKPKAQFKGGTVGRRYTQVYSATLDDLCADLIEPVTKTITPVLEKMPMAFISGFVRGLFDADGSVQGNSVKGYSVRLSQSNRDQLVAVQRMLGRLGVACTLSSCRRKAGMHMLPDGRGSSKAYACKAQWDLIIARDCIERFGCAVGFSEPAKAAKLARIINGRVRRPYADTFATKVVGVEASCETEPVYDCTIPDLHHFEANGLVVHNCGEIVLRPSQMCNLSEVVVRSDDDINSLKRKIRLATILGTMQATLTNFHYLRDIWKQNAEEEALLGVSLTGVMDNKLLSGQEGKSKLNDALEQLKAYAIETNKTWAKKLGINQATAVTTIKPSGTVSQLVDCASGMHPRWSQYYIRTVRGSINDPVAKMMMERGFPWEPSVMKPDVEVVFSFPVKAPDNCITVDRISAIEQLELWKAYKEHWCEHQPSITVYVREHEWMEVGAWVYKHFDIIGGLSFLPATGHTYQQAPYQAVPKAEYDALLKQMPELQDWSQLSAYEKDDSAVTATREIACSGGSCEIVDVIGK